MRLLKHSRSTVSLLASFFFSSFLYTCIDSSIISSKKGLINFCAFTWFCLFAPKPSSPVLGCCKTSGFLSFFCSQSRSTQSSSVLGVLMISIASAKEEKMETTNILYSREFQAMLDSLEDDDNSEETSQTTEKKRRLNISQVRALEKSFESDNKLDPERKVKLAQEIGLQPRQVAIWFQNRRARWKTKQLERDYGILKANYDALKVNYSDLEQEKTVLCEKLNELKAKLLEENADTGSCFKEESLASQQSKNHDLCDHVNGQERIYPGYSSSLELNGSSSSDPFMSDSGMILHNVYQPQLVKIEEQNFPRAEDSYNFFSVDQAPTLHWYFPEQ